MNYDLSLDYCVQNKLSTVGFLKGSSVADKYISELIDKNIHYVYGKLYNDVPELVYGDYGADSGSRNDQYANTRRFLKSIQSYESIKSIYQERQTDGKYLSLISNAKDIYVIGCVFRFKSNAEFGTGRTLIERAHAI